MPNSLFLRVELSRDDLVYFATIFGLLAVNDLLAVWAFYATFCR